MPSQKNDHSALRVDGRRLWARVMKMAEIGATPAGGVHRVALTDEDREGRDLFIDWCESAALEVSVDGIGNILARRPGRFRDAPPVVIGSHLDSQPSGGKFDGALGVLAALEAVETLNDHEIETKYAIEVVSWTNEEGSRFAPAMVASGVFAGVFDLDWARAIQDKWGVRMGDELRRIGYEGSDPVGGRDLRASIELHIEQGPILESAGTTIGVVTGVQGQRWYDVRIEGEATHAGPVPMKLRKDPVRGMARLLDRLFERVRGYDDQGRATVGVLETDPGSRNTQPASVRLTVDLRHPRDEDLTHLDGLLRELAAEVVEEMGLRCHIDEIWHSPTVQFGSECIAAVRSAADDLGYSHMDVFSGAGHDSVYLQRICPASMIFIPCEGGVSHAEHESITAADAEAGANVLLHAALTLAE